MPHSHILTLEDEETVTCLECGKLWLSDPEHVSSGEVRFNAILDWKDIEYGKDT